MTPPMTGQTKRLFCCLRGVEMQELMMPESPVTVGLPSDAESRSERDSKPGAPQGETQALKLEAQEKAQPEAEAIPESPEARVIKLEAELRKSNAALSTLEGRLKKTQEATRNFSAIASALQEEQRRNRRLETRQEEIYEHLTAAEPDAEKLRQRKQAHQQEDAASEGQQRLINKSGRLSASVEKRLARHEVELKDERFADALQTWERANEMFKAGRLAQAEDLLDESSSQFIDAFDVIQEANLAESSKEKRRSDADAQRRNGNLHVDGGTSISGAGVGDQELVNRMARGDKLTPTQVVKAGAAMDRGIYPKI